MPRDGLYFVYLKLYFYAPSQWVTGVHMTVTTKSRRLLEIVRHLRIGERKTVFTGGLFQLKAGEQIRVQTLNNGATMMLLGPHVSYFGAYMI